jgi:DNA adenine methylase
MRVSATESTVATVTHLGGEPRAQTDGGPAITAPSSILAHPRPLQDPKPLPDESSAIMRYQSPLRYPGAKSGLANVIGDLVASAAAKLGKPELFVEPFAGGASTALRLAGTGAVRRVLLADADPLVTRFWQVAAADTDWLIDRMWDEPVTLERWDHWRAWTPARLDDRDIAMKCLFLNRTTFSGILHGRAGPIGGRQQSSEYKIDCRFNKKGLETRLRFIGDLYRSNRLVDVWCRNWKDTLEEVPERYPALIPNRIIAYLDPPYMEKSEKLYRHSFDPMGGFAIPKSPVEAHDWLSGLGHILLAEYLRKRAQVRWILSYDNNPQLTSDSTLYAANRMNPNQDDAATLHIPRWFITKRLVDLRYSASARNPHRGKRQELLLTTLPPSCIPVGNRFSALPAARSMEDNGEP